MDQSPTPERPQKSNQAFRTISEVADELDLPQHVLRFWESKFKQISPMKRGGGRRYYRPEDVELLRSIKSLLHFDGYTIKGVQKLLSSGGLKSLNVAEAVAAPETVEDLPVEAAQVEQMGSVTSSIDLAGLAVLVRELEDIRDHMKKSVS